VETVRAAIQRVWHAATLLEWDDSIPSFDEVHDEALKANKFFIFHLAGDGGMRLAAVATNDGRAVMQPLTAGNALKTRRRRQVHARYASRLSSLMSLSSFDRLEITTGNMGSPALKHGRGVPGLRAVLAIENLKP